MRKILNTVTKPSDISQRAVQALSQPWCGESTTLIQWLGKQDQGKSPAKPDLQHKDSQLSHRIPQSHQLLPSLRAPHCLLTYESGLASAGRQSAEQSTLKKINTASFLPLTAHGCPSVRIMSYYLQKVSHQSKYYSICCFFSVVPSVPFKPSTEREKSSSLPLKSSVVIYKIRSLSH